MAFPIFFSNPDFVVGIPVSFAIRCFTFVMPNARFHEKDTPGILILSFITFGIGLNICRRIFFYLFQLTFPPFLNCR